MSAWVRVNDDLPKPNDYVILYVPEGRYFGASGHQFEEFRQEFPTVSHWKVLTGPPEE